MFCMENGHVCACNTLTKNRENWMRASCWFLRLRKNRPLLLSKGAYCAYFIEYSVQLNAKSNSHSIEQIAPSDMVSYHNPIATPFIWHTDQQWDSDFEHVMLEQFRYILTHSMSIKLNGCLAAWEYKWSCETKRKRQIHAYMKSQLQSILLTKIEILQSIGCI